MDQDLGDLGGFDDLRLRFVFVPDGQSVPEEVLAEFGEVVRIPAQFVPRWEPEPPVDGHVCEPGGWQDRPASVVAGSGGETPSPAGTVLYKDGERSDGLIGSLPFDYTRSYAPVRRRSNRPDPIGDAREGNGLYASSGNAPVNLTALSGLEANRLANAAHSLFQSLNPISTAQAQKIPPEEQLKVELGEETETHAEAHAPTEPILPGMTVVGGPQLIFGSGNSALAVAGAARNALQAAGTGRGPVYGTQVHTEFARQINSLGSIGLSAEVSYLDGDVVPYGTPGSVRVDVAEGSRNLPTAVYDLKTGSADLNAGRVQQIQAQVPGRTGVSIIKVGP